MIIELVTGGDYRWSISEKE